MNRQYFDNNSDLRSEKKEYSFNFKGNSFKFVTDVGVFSKSYIDFGSFVLLSYFEFNDSLNGPILDLGCGYGPIGVVTAKMTKKDVIMVDVNQRAVDLARENITKNCIKNAKTLISDGFESINDYQFSQILLNPPIRAGKQVIYRLYEESRNHLVENGELWIVIQKKQGAESSITKLESLFNEVKVVKKEKGYFVIKCILSIDKVDKQ